MKNTIILLSLVAIGFVSCKNNTTETTALDENRFEKLKNLQWMLGTWTKEVDTIFSQETWSRENDSTFTGYSFVEHDGKVVFAETMALELKGNNLELTVASAKTKEKKPVTFRMINSEKGHFTFENKSHDFPQRIIYTNPAKDSLHAWIEGTENGEPKKIDFYFAKH
ncbi:DUF6265 family protein [Aequorivita marisscotiae]|uniref:DUF6265 family protein n=1 Tax=Aequorivita marisscotiae TaxID=3040348 RepID=A0ABY8KTC5_9FLAO|nr:DUF6265 family protein [Aequorivita sp. Ant34-E75]WGF92689.1 DUF6265 family protein [Aequorivita sp. Ant34-E75]